MPFIIGALLIIADQIIKLAAVKYIKPAGSVEIIKDFFYLDYVENRGAAFGTFSGKGVFLLIITVIFMAVSVTAYIRINKTNMFGKIISLSLLVMISGAMGNFLDRIFRGYVVDMLHFIFWGHSFAVFNFADMLIVCSAFVLAVCTMFYESDVKKNDNIRR